CFAASHSTHPAPIWCREGGSGGEVEILVDALSKGTKEEQVKLLTSAGERAAARAPVRKQ
ncbi:MAG TPA: hypothetical protein VGP34_00635, partial [Pontimonas sp.]|nr:hypothetical protein [Pontimonas sp.]